MPSMRDIRRRIKSVKSTAQITKAMQMVASAKMRRSQQLALNGRPYAVLLNNMLSSIINRVGENAMSEHPLCNARPNVRREAVVLVTTDKGLCGSLNTNLLKEAVKYDPEKTVFLAAGRKGAQFLHRTKRTCEGEFSFHDTPQYSEARVIVRAFVDLFLSGKVDKVSVVFPRFKNTMSQVPDKLTILPITEIKPFVLEQNQQLEQKVTAGASTDILFEPTPEALFDKLLPHYLNTVIFHVLQETRACEFSARMVSMKSATDNANSLIKELTINYNKLRQTSITNQLLEIASATSALS